MWKMVLKTGPRAHSQGHENSPSTRTQVWPTCCVPGGMWDPALHSPRRPEHGAVLSVAAQPSLSLSPNPHLVPPRLHRDLPQAVQVHTRMEFSTDCNPAPSRSHPSSHKTPNPLVAPAVHNAEARTPLRSGRPSEPPQASQSRVCTSGLGVLPGLPLTPSAPAPPPPPPPLHTLLPELNPWSSAQKSPPQVTSPGPLRPGQGAGSLSSGLRVLWHSPPGPSVGVQGPRPVPRARPGLLLAPSTVRTHHPHSLTSGKYTASREECPTCPRRLTSVPISDLREPQLHPRPHPWAHADSLGLGALLSSSSSSSSPG